LDQITFSRSAFGPENGQPPRSGKNTGRRRPAIEKAKLPALEAGVYYWNDLIGLKVFTTEDQYLGRLESIIETGANDVYVVKGDAREILIPALKSVVHTIDIDAKIMRVELPDGLEE
jgi:16S rRNA processing protein RimM